MNFDESTIKQKIKNLPMSHGVYIMKDIDGNIIYIGKSKLLKNRVSSYFINSKNHSPKTLAMVSSVADFDYIVTDSEVEALILECNLIKKHRPKYNILLKDDKNYPYIKITTNEEYPRVFMTRKLLKDGSKYFGPYMSTYMVKDTLEAIKHIFKVRSCNKRLPNDIGRSKPCLYYHIGQCSAPCANKISQEEYYSAFNNIESVLNGNVAEITKNLKAEMYRASENLEFEKAARLRDRIQSIDMLSEKQKMLSTNESNCDIIGFYSDGEQNSCIQIFYMRDGKISGSDYFIFDNFSSKTELVVEFIKQYYFSTTMIPKEILIPDIDDDCSDIELWLRERLGHKIVINRPKRGKKASLVEMVSKNAEESLQKYKFNKNREKLKQNEILLELKTLLNLEKTPYKIEAYDISNISGADSIGVCVVYINAKESRKNYRKFNIKTVAGANDYESMREVVYRRIMRAYKEEEDIKNGSLKEEDAKFLPLPDLILLDGGKGHVSSVKLLLETLGEEIPVFGLVKDDKHRTRGITDEYEELSLNKEEMLFSFLTCIQDEVHRFAIKNFTKKHENSTLSSELDNISGIGPAKRNILLKTFISVERIKNASFAELAEVVGKKVADNIVKFYSEKNNI